MKEKTPVLFLKNNLESWQILYFLSVFQCTLSLNKVIETVFVQELYTAALATDYALRLLICLRNGRVKKFTVFVNRQDHENNDQEEKNLTIVYT